MKQKKSKKRAAKPREVSSPKPAFKHLAIILTAGILVRLIYDASLANNLFLGTYILDSLVLHSWATDILAGKTADTAFFRAPLYPYALALVYKMFGVSPWSAILFHNILGLLTGVISYLFAGRLFGQKVAVWAGLVVVIYPTLIYFEGETMITTLAVFLYTLTAYRLFVAVEKPSVKNVVKVGLVFGLAAITRPSILPLVVIFPVAFLAKHGFAAVKDGIIKSLVFVTALFVPILPVTLTNLVKGGEFVLISTQGGANFYIGNSQDADGITVVAPGPNLRIGPYNDNIWTSSIDEAERRNGRKLTQSEVSSFWFGEALDEIKSDIRRAAGLFSKKFYYFWHGQEIFNNKSLYYAGEYSWLMSGLLWKKLINFPSGILFPLTFLGMFLGFRNKQQVLVPVLYAVLFALVVSAFFVCARFRQPILPLAIMLATYGLAELVRLYRKNRKVFFAGCAALVVLIVGLNWGGNIESKQNLSQFQGVIGSVYLKRKDYPTAITYLEKSLEASEGNMGVYDLLGQAYMNSRRLKDAEKIYQRGIELFPRYSPFNFNLGRLSQLREDFEKAKEYYHLTLKYAPEFAPALDRLGYVFDLQNQPDSALYYYRRLAKLRPFDSKLKAKIESLEQTLKQSQ